MSDDFKIPDTSDTEETGRFIMFFHPEALPDVSRAARDLAGMKMPTTRGEAEEVAASGEWGGMDAFVLPTLGVAVSSVPPEQMALLAAAADDLPIRRVRREYVFRIASDFGAPDVRVSSEYLRGFRAGVDALAGSLLGGAPAPSPLAEAQVLAGTSFRDNESFTWGLQATGVSESQLTGRGVRVALLDTGFDAAHPDFAGREQEVVSMNFVPGVQTAADDNGHGTHCLGTLGGPLKAGAGPRYGIACDAELFVGKVMKSTGKGDEWDILKGIEWAIQNRCRIVSLSLGKEVAPGASPDPDYEEIGALALSHNCLLIAAAGNESERPGPIAPVNIPANSRTVMAVGAIDRRLGLFRNSNGGLNPDGGQIDLVGPGVEVRSSKRLPPHPHYGNASGTSMATPHVAGVAALLMQEDPGATAEAIWARLTQRSLRLDLPGRDVGNGLVRVG
ncbi:MAG TPA: S8 family serine peptidase [Pyrinomonadaceae bacterium]|jgi:subtilisin family serine protease